MRVPGILLILALTEELLFVVQGVSPSLASSQDLLTNNISNSAMGMTPRQRNHHTTEPSPTAALASFHPASSMMTTVSSMGQKSTSSPVGNKEPYHLSNRSAVSSGKTRPKGKLFQIVKGNLTEFTEPSLKTGLYSPSPNTWSRSPDHPFQTLPTTHRIRNSSVLVTTTDSNTSFYSDFLDGLKKAEMGNSTETVEQETELTTPSAGPSAAPEMVTVPFKPPRYGIWDLLGKNNSWVISNQTINQVPFFTSPGTVTASSASSHAGPAGVDVNVSLHATSSPNGTSMAMRPPWHNTSFPSSMLSVEPSTWLSTSTSTATGNFLNRLVPAGTWKPGMPGNISHVTERDKPQHRATICLSKVDIAWIILAISVPISSCSVLLTVCCMRRKKKASNPETNLSYWNNAITMDYFNRHAVELPREIQSLETSEDHLSEPRSPANGDYRDTSMVLVNPFCQETLFVGREQVSEI
ncbi:transmembrane protein 108 isoform X2 [Paroedura picta]|uniref:transmembrane protein 108 isoform X2 n=1 Tax=Paroedura picta TaxID=143630 RepID=UPI004055B44C